VIGAVARRKSATAGRTSGIAVNNVAGGVEADVVGAEGVGGAGGARDRVRGG